MGTTYHVKVVSSKTAEAPALQSDIDSLLADINQSMSTYIPDSEINRFSHWPIGKVFPASDAFLEVMIMARDIYRLSSGAFDPTVGPLVDLWGFGPTQGNDQVPEDAAIQELLADIGFDKIAIDRESKTITRLHALTVDLSAIAKGYAVDRVSELLTDRKFGNHMVEIGGELRLSGLNAQEKPWQIAIEAPVNELGAVQRIVSITEEGLATSGDYRNYFEKDGKRFSHTIDPLTGKPIEHNLASVTVVRKTSAEADGLATAFMVMGVNKAKALADAEDIAAFFVVKGGSGFQEQYSRAFAGYLHGENLDGKK